MFKQNYINIFENAGGDITLAYATCKEDPLQMDEVQFVALEKTDLHTIGQALTKLHYDIENEDS